MNRGAATRRRAGKRAATLGLAALLGMGFMQGATLRGVAAGDKEISAREGAIAKSAHDAESAEQSPATREAFDRYVRITEARISTELTPGGAFLWPDKLHGGERDGAYAALRRGEIQIERVATLDHGQEIFCPRGMIHHWVGIVFVPGATLDQTLRMVQDYDHHAEVYAPDVVRSKLISRSGDNFRVFMRFRRKKIVTVVLDTEHDVRYQRLDATRAASRSVSTRIQEVHDAGAPDERDLPEGEGGGFLWRINSYWRFQERDGGTYVQCESVSLTRDIPTGFGWLIGPFVESIPRESLRFTLEAARNHLEAARNSAVK